MTELEIMKRAKSYVDMLANGVDPISGEGVAEDNFINNVRISRCLFYVSDVLQKVIDNGGTAAKRGTADLIPFAITDEQAAQIEITDTPVGIADFTKRINAVIDAGVKPLAATQITGWLLTNGYLAENIYGGKKKKVVSPRGMAIGIETVDGVTKTGVPYQKNVYTAQAQGFIVENLNKITGDLDAKSADPSQQAAAAVVDAST